MIGTARRLAGVQQQVAETLGESQKTISRDVSHLTNVSPEIVPDHRTDSLGRRQFYAEWDMRMQVMRRRAEAARLRARRRQDQEHGQEAAPSNESEEEL